MKTSSEDIADVGVHDIRQLIERGQWARLAAGLGFDVARRAEIPTEAYAVWGLGEQEAAAFERLEVLAAAAGYRLMLVEGGGSWRELRRMMLGVNRVNPEELVLWWWVRADTATVSLVSRQADGRRFVRRMDLDRADPDPVGLQQWAKLDIGEVAGEDLVDRTQALRRHVREVLDQEGLTRRFFVDFEAALELLCERMVDGPEAERDRHDVALATLLRLVFLYLLQLRGALDGDRRFVLRRLREARNADKNYYRAVLRPLFFGALNCPKGRRDAAATALGELPFLNGGLFEPLPIERAQPDLSWPNEVWGEVIEGLLEHYHFAVEEMEGADEQRAVDPEMLGRVFEGLMYGDSRQTSGSFYTPRDVVRKLVDEALSGYLLDTTSLDGALVEHVLAGESVELNDTQRAELREALDTVRILDPAVGTGAFLLEALQALRRCRRALGAAERSDGPLAEYRRVRALIHEHLFGVDIQHTAVRLCELRLWLALFSTLPTMPIDELPPLPNLSHKVCVGNSLLSPADLVGLRCGQRSFADWADSLAGESNRELVGRLERLRDRYLTTHGQEKAALRDQMGELEVKLQRAMLEARAESIEARLEPLARLASSRDLFGEDVALDEAQRRDRDALVEELEAVREAVEAIDAGREARLAFSYEVRFGRLLAEEGFDIVITNPPWVRAHRIDAAQREVLQSRYRSHRRTLWRGAKRAGIRAPFGPQVDLAALFVERSLELLRPGGRLCGLVPAKLFSSLHGTALREQLAEHALVALEDYSDADRRMFDATVYPAMLHVKKRPATRRRAQARPARAPKPVRLSVWRGETRRQWQTRAADLPVVDGQPGAPWVFAEPSVAEIFDQLAEGSSLLGEVERLQPVRGLFTGCNDVFVHDDSEAKDLLGEHLEAWSRPVLSGRDVRPWEATAVRRILWGYDEHMELRQDLPARLRAYFERHAERLEGRSDYRSQKPLWQMFRVKQGLVRPKVVWRDMSPRLEAALVDARTIPLNTVYFIPLADEVEARLLTALFNSPPLRAVAYALGERARGGWRRHFAWVMRLLPIPKRLVDFLEASDQQRAARFGDLLDLEARVRADVDEPVSLLAQRLYGLSSEQIEVLESWRLGEAALEVA